MTNDFDEYRAYALHLSSEHRRLSTLVRQIETQMAKSTPIDRQNVKQLGDSLKQLRAELASHFEEEERGGCLEEAVVRHPRLASEAGKTLQEHTVLLAELDRFIQSATVPKVAGPHGNSLEEFTEFAGHLRAHEAAESRILHDGFDTALS